jgi:two-component system sensor histidine kinase/response regulator
MKGQDSIDMKGTVLIVDDIPKNLQLLGKTLRDEGYKIVAVSKSEQVLESTKKYMPDLILLDVMMPVKTGFEVCEELKATKELEHIPVIFLTAKVEQDSIIKGLELGGADYITKPFNTSELIARVCTHVSLKKSKDLLAKKNEELEQLSIMKDKIYSVIGHDLRGPIHGIKGVCELLIDNVEEDFEMDMHKTFLSLIQNSSNNIWNLLTDLLSWARLQNNELKMDSTPFSPLSAVNKGIEVLSHTATKKKIDIKINCEEDFEFTGDKLYVSTIVRNFASNAIKFSEENSSVIVDLNNENGLRVSVTDFGAGMSKETVDKLFKFKRHPKDNSEMNLHGAGFGLLLCNDLAKMHGGSIEVKSVLGEGSTFTLYLPSFEKQGVEAA